ncbi:MAG: large conductance mechanosensitive channel protein MscL [Ilumatobacteraceae bacterium]
MRNFLKEFKEFIATGNMLELAVAVILGAAVGAVIKAFTEGIVMQVIAAIFGKPDFSSVTIVLRKNVACTTTAGVKDCTDSVLQIGTLINTLITLVITGLVLFMMIKAYNRLKRKQVAEEPGVPQATEVELLMEIRDALKARN